MEVFSERTGIWNVESTSAFMQYRAQFTVVRVRTRLLAFGGCMNRNGQCTVTGFELENLRT